MPSNLKKLVRARMEKTGETYQGALRHVREADGMAPRGDLAPRLLLDTNIYRHIDGRLAGQNERLLRVAAHRTPPLLWACEITFDELVYRIRRDDSQEFERCRRALRWMERLCGGRGMAEDNKWILRSGVFEQAAPYDGRLAVELVKVRRGIIETKTVADFPDSFWAVIEELRTGYQTRIDAWVAGRTTTGEAARVRPLPGAPVVEGSEVAAGAVLEISRKHAANSADTWGAFRSDEDQRRAQRELIAFEVSLLDKARHPQGYNHDKHRSDYNDYWLCAYCAAGYTLVTADDRLRRSLLDAGCKDPRLVSLEEALAIAESWLARPR
jgi:hypothetical protein